MTEEKDIVEAFEITGRGIVVVISEITAHLVGKPYQVEIITPEGKILCSVAFKEWLLRRQPTVVENEAYVMRDLHKMDIPKGSRLRFIE